MILHLLEGYSLLSSVATIGFLVWGRARARRVYDDDGTPSHVSHNSLRLRDLYRAAEALGHRMPWA